jgi:hypothetical protein
MSPRGTRQQKQIVRTDQHVSISVNVLVSVEKLATVRDANEECTTSAGRGGGLRNMCWHLSGGDDISVVGGGKTLFHVGEAGTAAREPTQQFSQASCMRGKG